jgi:Cu/Zn superoxide dismutase
MRHLRFAVIFYRMRHPLMLFVIALVAIFLVVGCGGGSSKEGGSSQSGQKDHHDSSAAKLDLRPEGDSGVSGSASFKDSSDGIVIELELRGLPRSNTSYLAHIHPGTCAKEAKEGHAHEEEHGEHPAEGEGQEHEEEYVFGHGEEGEISYALSQVKSNSEGRGSSTTMFGQLSVDELFSGEPKHVMVHEAGSGDPPILTCADLERAG